MPEYGRCFGRPVRIVYRTSLAVPAGSGSQGRPDETGSAHDQADGRRDEGPGGSANSLGHPLIESGALLHYPDIEGLLCTPSDVLPADVTQEVEYLWVVEDNQRARAFYRKSGFSPDGRARSWQGPGVSCQKYG